MAYPTKNHIILVCGLGSSILFFFKAWARDLENMLTRHYGKERLGRDIKIWVVTADGLGERKAIEAVIADHQAGRLANVTIAGHSNGGRDGPARMSQRLFNLKGGPVSIPYAAVIDMTAGEFGAVVYGNVAVLDEFWAGLQKTDFHPSFKKPKNVHNFFDLDKISKKNIFHIPSASLPFVQDRIFQQITAVIK